MPRFLARKFKYFIDFAPLICTFLAWKFKNLSLQVFYKIEFLDKNWVTFPVCIFRKSFINKETREKLHRYSKNFVVFVDFSLLVPWTPARFVSEESLGGVQGTFARPCGKSQCLSPLRWENKSYFGKGLGGSETTL